MRSVLVANDTIVSETFNEYNGALGAVTGSTTHTWKNNAFQATARTDTAYQWYDGAVVSSVSHRPTTSSGTFTTSYYYDGSGALTSAYVSDGRPRSITYTNDMAGQVLRRDEQDNRYPAYNRPYENGDPHEIWFRFGGKQMGYSGNNGTTDTDYASSVAARTRAAPTTTAGAFRGGAAYGGSYTDFDQSLESINSYEQGGSGGGYVVRAGDTLSGIAANLWGDAGLWYKLAEANGLSQQSGLAEGQRLTIPAGVSKNTHNASTFKPYDPSDAIGETSPTNPAPNKAPKKNKCGVFGAVLLVAIAVAVTVVTAGAAVAALAPASAGIGSIGAGITAFAAGSAATGLGAGAMIGIGAAAAMAGSIASQGVGVATGIQDKFSWKGVAMAGIAGAVGAGLGPIGGTGFVGGAIRGALGSAISQGIGVATGLQGKFDWAGVAAAGIGGGVSAALGGKLAPLGKTNTLANHLSHAGVSAASAIANAATRSLINGSNFGDNILAALPDVIGSTIGNMVANGVSAPIKSTRTGDIIVTGSGAAEASSAPEGAQGTTAKASSNPTIADVAQGAPLTDEEKALVRRYNLVEQKQLVLPDARAELAKRESNLLKAQKAGEGAKKIAALQIKVNQASANVQTIEQRIGTISTIVSKVNTYIENKSFTVKTASGEEVRRFYGANHDFDSANLAVDNAIAYGMTQAAIFGDNRERGGFVYTTSSGKFRYTLNLGAEGSSRWNKVKGYENVGDGQPFVPFIKPTASTVAQWHIHPKGFAEDANFSVASKGSLGDTGTIKAFDQLRRDEGLSGLKYYLGGNDRSRDLIYYNTSTKKWVQDNGTPRYFK